MSFLKKIAFNKTFKEFKKFRPANNPKDLFCYAPYTTITFTQDGIILPCYYNKQKTFGQYFPEIDYIELWKNNSFKTLRERIACNDLSFGCYSCRFEFQKKNFHTVYAQRYDHIKDEILAEQPIALDFQISNKCNFKCIMCTGENSSYIREKREGKENYKSAYDDYFPHSLAPLLPKIKFLKFAGGEPFLIPQYKQIMKIARHLNSNIEYSFGTNGSLFREEDFDFFETENVQLTISYESTNKEVFESIRCNSNFETVHNNLIRVNDIMQKKGRDLNVKICPMVQNIEDIPNTFLFLNSLNINIMFNNVLFPPGSALWFLSSSQLSDIVNALKSVKLPGAHTRTQERNMLTFNSLIRQIIKWCENAKMRESKFKVLNYNYSQLLNEYYFNIRNYIRGSVFLASDESNLNIIPDLLNPISDSEIKFNSLFYFCNLPLHWQASEFNFRSADKLKDRVRDVIQYFQNKNR